MDRIKAKIARNQVIEGNEVTAMVFFYFQEEFSKNFYQLKKISHGKKKNRTVRKIISFSNQNSRSSKEENKFIKQ